MQEEIVEFEVVQHNMATAFSATQMRSLSHMTETPLHLENPLLDQLECPAAVTLKSN